MSATPGTVHLAVEDGVALVTLDRPSRRNALDLPMWQALAARVGEASAAGARTLIVTGAGPHFSAGMDLRPDNPLAPRVVEVVFGKDRDGAHRLIEELKLYLEPLRTFGGLTIAAIEGSCLGSGLEVALHCDVRVAATDASLALPEARWGMVADVGGSTLLTRLVGPGRAALWLGTGRTFTAQQAYAHGVVEELSGPGGARAAALAMAKDALRCSPAATKEVLALVRTLPGQSLGAGFLRETEAGADALMAGDVAEGLAAFAERRAPSWAPPEG